MKIWNDFNAPFRIKRPSAEPPQTHSDPTQLVCSFVLTMPLSETNFSFAHLLSLIILTISLPDKTFCIRFPDRTTNTVQDQPDHPLKSAVFALGCFWRSEAVFGCLNGVVRTTAGYAGGSKTNPDFRSLGDHAESVLVLFILIDYRCITFVIFLVTKFKPLFGYGCLFLFFFFGRYTIT